MTSVPKPLKFLRPHLQTLKETFAKLAEGDNKRLLADIISLLAMTDAPVENVMPESLKYRLVGSDEDIGTWGHEAGRGELRRASERTNDDAHLRTKKQPVPQSSGPIGFVFVFWGAFHQRLRARDT